jgi:hypothetical protein
MESLPVVSDVSPAITPIKPSKRLSSQQSKSHLASPSRTTSSPSPGPSRHEVYYYYQSSDGQQYYLHSLDTKILLAEYGDYSAFPERIDVVVSRIELFTWDPNGRKRFKALEGVGLGSSVGFCHGVWKDVLKEETLEKFRKEIDKREAIAIGKTRREDAESRRRSTRGETGRDELECEELVMSPGNENAFPTMSASPGAGSWKSTGWGGGQGLDRLLSSTNSPRMRAIEDEEMFSDDWRLDLAGLEAAVEERLEREGNAQFEAAIVASNGGDGGSGGKKKGKKGGKGYMLVSNSGGRRR